MSEHTRMMVVAAMERLQEVVDGSVTDDGIGSVNGAIGIAIDMLTMAIRPPPWAEAIQPGVTVETVKESWERKQGSTTATSTT